MEKIFKDYLFGKQILVNDGKAEEYPFETLFAIANLFEIRIKEGVDLAEHGMIEYISSMIGKDVPAPFYKGFPESVKKLSSDELLFDQMVHYCITYGFGNFSRAGHSMMEEYFDRCVFKEKTEIREFVIITEEEAERRLKEDAENLLLSSRPLNAVQYDFLLAYIKDYKYEIKKCASKNTAIRLLSDTEDLKFTRFIVLSDVIKLLEEINYRDFIKENQNMYSTQLALELKKRSIKKLNLKNRRRKLITLVINRMFEDKKADIKNCFEKKKIWCGLLHHIHYQPINEEAREFVNAIRGRENLSVYSSFEKAIKNKDINDAVNVLKEGKGSGAILRNLDYLISRAASDEDVKYITENISSENAIILLQLYIKYSLCSSKIRRSFKFTKFEMLKTYTETEEEYNRRKSYIGEEKSLYLKGIIKENLERLFKNKLGKVYIDPAMKDFALPLQETATQSGFGVLAKGSVIHIEEGRKIRAFTYWEKVDDIDLSCFGITEDGTRLEFSWRTMADNQSDAITYSGDETSGYYGGSEFFDINLDEFKKTYPTVRYIVFCDNVFSAKNFSTCYCTAGYMIRDDIDSGEIFEPKTVKSSFRVNAESTYACLFGIDLLKRELVWLNIAFSGAVTVAGTQSLDFILDYFKYTDIINMKSFFELMATEITTDSKEADVIVSNDIAESEVGEGKKLIRSYDFEKIMAFMNLNF